jgi:hypothetical protein
LDFGFLMIEFWILEKELNRQERQEREEREEEGNLRTKTRKSQIQNLKLFDCS